MGSQMQALRADYNPRHKIMETFFEAVQNKFHGTCRRRDYRGSI